MQLNKHEFLTAMKQAMPGVESGNPILQGADTFIFHDGFIHTYNDTISVSVHFPITNKAGENISAAIKAKDFYDLISRYEGDAISIIPKSDMWIVKSENARAELTLLENNLIERIQGITNSKFKWVNIPERFFEGLAICNFKSQSQLSGVYCADKNIISTDNLKVNYYTLDDEIVTSFWINNDAVTELLKLNNVVKYYVSDSWVHFQTEDKTIFSCKRLAQDNYPYIKVIDFIESHKKKKVTLVMSFQIN
jgi:DNA polymerase III sliding clamp (beta) subunit (PCNA family)